MYQNVSRQNELSTELYEAKNLVFNLLNLLNRTLGNLNLIIFWQYFAISIFVKVAYNKEQLTRARFRRMT